MNEQLHYSFSNQNHYNLQVFSFYVPIIVLTLTLTHCSLSVRSLAFCAAKLRMPALKRYVTSTIRPTVFLNPGSVEYFATSEIKRYHDEVRNDKNQTAKRN